MKAIVFDRIGPPLDVLYLADVPIPKIGANEVLLKMVSASINPGDFLFIQNLYPEPKKPVFPKQIGGNHGAGIVTEVGKGVSLAPGTLVAYSYFNTWAEFAAVPPDWLLPLPAAYPLEKAGQFVNPITAWDLLNASQVKPGQWLALTAGNSSVATMVLQFARRKGVKVISIVRQAHKQVDLKALGASEVIDLSHDSTGIRERIMEITRNNGISGVVDSVGGSVTGELIRSMAFGGQVIINGGMSPERFQLHNFDVLLRGIEIKAYVYRYFFNPPQEGDTEMLQQIAEIFSQPDFQVPLGGVHALDDFKTAVDESINHPERGKRLFKISE
jgi:NADPH2:quinone reductase